MKTLNQRVNTLPDYDLWSFADDVVALAPSTVTAAEECVISMCGDLLGGQPFSAAARSVMAAVVINAQLHGVIDIDAELNFGN